MKADEIREAFQTTAANIISADNVKAAELSMHLAMLALQAEVAAQLAEQNECLAKIVDHLTR